jgi:hypothetical protein
MAAWQSLLRRALIGPRSAPGRAPAAPRPLPTDGLARPRGTAAALSWPSVAQLTELGRADVAWAAATGLASAALFATTLTGHPYLGDAPETVAGVSSLGVLHDPGYPTYVLFAHLFSLLVPFGSEAFSVNLFSLVCGSLTIAGVQLLARRFGVPRWAASIGALTLAASAGFWFYTGFAKHDIFSGLLFVLSLHLALAVQVRATTARLAWLAVAIAIGLGSSWPLELLVLPSVAYALFTARSQLRLGSLASATAIGLVVVVAAYGFVMVRAAENPPINWGGATTPARLWSLVNRADFTAHGGSAHFATATPTAGGAPGSSGASAPSSSGGATVAAPASVVVNVTNLGKIFARELGIFALILAALGLVASLTWRRSLASFPLLIAFAANLIGAHAVVNFGGSSGSFDGDLISEGFVLGSYFALACWVAIGASELVAGGARLGVALGATRGPLAVIARPRLLTPLAAIALGAVLVVPLVSGNRSIVRGSSKPFADRYAESAFAELPPHAALFIQGAELTEPLIYRQVVYHQRRDVVVIASDGLEYGWYLQQLDRRLGLQLPPATGNPLLDAATIMRAVSRVRPVYLDPVAAQTFARVIGYRPVGLLEQLAPGTGPQKVNSPDAVEARLQASERQAGFPDGRWGRWPNDYVQTAEYGSAALKVAQAYYQLHAYAGMRSALLNGLMVEPGNQIAQLDLAKLYRSGLGG